MSNVIKKDGSTEPWNADKITRAITLASSRTKETISPAQSAEIISFVLSKLPAPTVTVAEVHRLVENALMHQGLYDSAREYITYRAEHKPDIFRKRTNYKPFEYPELADFRLAILNNFWIHTHFNYNPDVQDMMVNMPADKVQVAKRAILAISQIEVQVKRFWSKVGTYLPKPEIEEVGAVFAANEVIHAMAYSNLIEVMNLNQEFINILKVPAIKRRVAYLESTLVTPVESADYLMNVLLFSVFIENISLFSQFYILLKFHKENKWLKGTSNAIKATCTEENLHAKFGFALVNTIRAEHPEWWTDELINRVYVACDTALEAEQEVLSWIMEGSSSEEIDEVRNFINSRMNLSLESIGLPHRCYVNPKYDYKWFDLLVAANSATDFFDSKATSYSKGVQTFDSDSLF